MLNNLTFDTYRAIKNKKGSEVRKEVKKYPDSLCLLK